MLSSLFHLNVVEKELSWKSEKLILNHLAIVVVPHQDDESIGMGGSIAKLINAGFTIRIIYTTVEKLNKKLNTDPAKRKGEAVKASQILGVLSKEQIFFMDLPDGNLRVSALNFSKSAGKLQALIRDIESETGVNNTVGHTLILTTSRLDAHRDHEETFNLVKNALRKRIIMEFPTVNHISSEFQPNCLIDISNFTSIKKKALNEYNGEIIKQRILWSEINLWDQMNGKTISVESAESCFISWYGILNIDQQSIKLSL